MELVSAQCPYYAWVTKDGRILRPSEMEDSHILSTLKLLEAKAKSLKTMADWELATMKGPSGDMAQLAFEHEQIVQYDMPALEWVKETKIYRLLKEEVERRGILSEVCV